jgi:opacity protein-like surface antigen
MKKVLGGLAVAGLLTAGVANAGTITVANASHVNMYGGLSVGYLIQDNDIIDGTRSDNVRIMSAVLGLAKPATKSSPVGFNFALAQFQVPTLIASNEAVNLLPRSEDSGPGLIGLGRTDDNLKIWLAEVQVKAPNTIEGLDLTLSGGLLWSRYGERPVTILNKHINRGLMFVFFNPVAFTGVRADVAYTFGPKGQERVIKFYTGYNQANGLALIPDTIKTLKSDDYNPVFNDPKDAFEFGTEGVVNLGFAKFNVKLDYFDEAGGRNIVTARTNLNFKNVVAGGLQFSYASKDDKLKEAIKDVGLTQNVGDDYWGIGFNFNIMKFDQALKKAQIEVPMRIEYVKLDVDMCDNDTDKDKIWSFTITPTWRPTANSFVRAEYTYTKADSQIFVDPDNGADTDDTMNTFGLEAGFLF